MEMPLIWAGKQPRNILSCNLIFVLFLSVTELYNHHPIVCQRLHKGINEFIKQNYAITMKTLRKEDGSLGRPL